MGSHNPLNHRVRVSKHSMQTPHSHIVAYDLEEEVPRMLESVNPLVPQSLVKFCYAAGEFEIPPVAPPTIQLMHMESFAVSKSSEEAMDEQENNFLPLTTIRPSLARLEGGIDTHHVHEFFFTEEVDFNQEDINEEEGERDVNGRRNGAALLRAPKKVPNAFNFCDIGAQTYTTFYQSSGSQTEALARGGFEAVFSPSLIFDAYSLDFERMQLEKALGLNEPAIGMAQPEASAQVRPVDIVDRVVNQNIYDDISFDYSYFEDGADEFRSSGSLLPLWRFFKPAVSANNIVWNPKYNDLIAVAFGVADFDSLDEAGYIVLYTMKNPSHPEYTRKTWTGVVSLSFNSQLPHLLAVGFYDGHVAVYDTSSTDENPVYKSCYSMSHTRAVSGVIWTKTDSLGYEAFLSISYDGYVRRWMVKKTGLEGTAVMMISLGKGITGPGGMTCPVYGSGYAIQIDPLNENEYFVGTCTGEIRKYNVLHGESIMHLKAHDLPVRRILHNAFVPRIFLSCSEDWNVKLWQDGREDPLITFGLGHPVIDVSWSPYTSTVFAALSTDGFIHIFDLHMDRQRPICRQGVVSTMQGKEPTRMFFNHKFPAVAIGDTHGSVTILKLSPNLRQSAKPSKKEFVEPWELEVRKLEKVLSYSKPTSFNYRNDTQINQV